MLTRSKLRRRSLFLEPLENRSLLATFVVDNATDTFQAGHVRLSEAIEQATNNTEDDTITFADAITTIDLTSGITVFVDSNRVTIDGGSDVTIRRSSSVPADTFFSLFDIHHNVKYDFNGLTFSGGQAFAGGGAISNSGTVTVSRSIFVQNTVPSQGGIGGAIYNGGTLTVSESTFSGNSADNGGAISNFGDATISSSTFAGNFAVGEDFNSQGNGGAIATGNGSLTLVNSTFFNNQANREGGAIAAAAGSVTLVNCTLAKNKADSNSDSLGSGGGIRVGDGVSVTLFNTIVAGNTVRSSTAHDIITGNTPLDAASSSNLIGDAGTAGGLTNGVNGNLVGKDVSTVLAASLADNGGPTQTIALIAGSPALHAGDNSHATVDGQVGSPALDNDQRGSGFPRSTKGTVDIGAFEAQPTGLIFVVSKAGDDDDLNYAAGQLTLREAVNKANANYGTTTITFANSLSTIDLTSKLELMADVQIDGGGKVTVRRLTSSASEFGIFQVDTYVTAELLGLTISGGKAGTGSGGGGILNQGTLTISQSTISQNTANDGGGGIQNIRGTLAILQSTISGNHATDGGGIQNDSGTLTVSQSTISGNSADVLGSGFDVLSGHATISQSTISMNTGAGNSVESAATLLLSNSIIAGNDGDLGGTADPASSNNLIGDPSLAGELTNGTNGNIVGVNGAGKIPIAQILSTTLANNGGPTKTHALVKGSKALDAGSDANATVDGQVGHTSLTKDQRGLPRFAGTVDIGAYEAQDIQAAITGPTAGVPGQPLQYKLTASKATGVTGNIFFQIDWGDGSPKQTVIGPATGALVTHAFLQQSGFVSVAATNAAGGVGDADTVVTITTVNVVGNVVYVGGTAGNDRIFAEPTSTTGERIAISMNGQNLGTFSPSQLVVYGNAGKDTILLNARITLLNVPARLFGGSGDDFLDARGNSANSILVGGSGNDTLAGSRRGRSILIGGSEKDQLIGQADSILIGGTTTRDGNLAALDLLMATWSGTGTYAQRVHALKRGTAARPALNANTVFKDASVDELTGGRGPDWFFASGANEVKSKETGEIVTTTPKLPPR